VDGGIATVLAAAIGLVAGGGGALLSGAIAYKAGRRQVHDQGLSTHRQWILQQRQEAYVGYLNSCHVLIKAVDDCTLALGTAEATNDDSIYAGALACVDVASYRAAEVSEGETDYHLDRIFMLGPVEVCECARSLRTSMRSLVENLGCLTNGLIDAGPRPPEITPPDDWWSAVERSRNRVLESRTTFVAAAQETLTHLQTSG
jgi:hypothetical protein